MMADEATESPGIIAGGVSAKPVTSAHYVLFANKSLSAYRRLGVLHRRGVLALDQGLVGQGRKGDRLAGLRVRFPLGVEGGATARGWRRTSRCRPQTCHRSLR